MFIHEAQNWTAFKWNQNRISNLLEEVNRMTGYLSGRLSSIGFDNQMFATVEAVTSDIVSSSDIEGVKLDEVEVRSSVARKLGVKIEDHKEPTHYVDGVVEMMLDATQNFNLTLSEERLMGWHRALFPTGKSGSFPINAGKYREEGMEVVSGTFGRERIHYRAPSPDRIPGEMKTFLEWFEKNRENPTLLVSAIAHLWFVSVHPFDDGNGRIARAISDMALSRADKNRFRYYSMSSQICADKKEYYRVLEQTQRGDGDITAWLEWYLNCMKRAIASSDSMLSRVLNKSVFWKNHSSKMVSDRQRRILNIYLDRDNSKFTIKNWAKLAQVSKDTANRDIKDLISKGILKPASQGRIRDISYMINYVPENLQAGDFSNAAIENIDGVSYISAVFRNTRPVKDRLSEMDILRYNQNETSLDDLVYKYFAYLTNPDF